MSSNDRPTTPSSADVAHAPPIGTVVEVNGVQAVVRYAGETSFATGMWVGLELDTPTGKNDGSVQGVRYFECAPNFGLFIRASQLRGKEIGQSANATPTSRARAPLSGSRPGTPSSLVTPLRNSSRSIPSPNTNKPTPLSTQARPPSRRVSAATTIDRVKSPPPRPPSPRTTGTSRSTSAKRLSRSGSASSTDSPVLTGGRSAERRPSISKSDRSPSLSRPPRKSSAPAPEVLPIVSNAFRHSPTTPVQPKLPPTPAPQQTNKQRVDEFQSPVDEYVGIPASVLEAIKPPVLPEPVPVPVPPSEVQESVDPDVRPSPSLSSASPSKFAQLVPLRDVEDLRIKVKHLEQKRAEDREKLLELERLRTELESSLVVRNKLTEKLQEVQGENKETRRQLDTAVGEKESMEQQVVEIQESMEMLLLDKEMAEEKAESLQAEVRALEERIEELSLDLEVIKQEQELGNVSHVPHSDGDNSEERPAVELVQLERQNERLKEALVRLRDMAAEQELMLKQQVEDLESELGSLRDIKAERGALVERLQASEAIVEELKAMVDDSLGAEDIVESLTERNMALNERLEEYKAVIQDLEVLKELNDELEQDHIETEKQLQEEIDIKDRMLLDSVQKSIAQEETIADYERTIRQFRELVRHLQSDIERLHQPDNQKATNLDSQSQTMVSLNLQLQSTTIKAQARAVELELRKLEIAQVQQQLEMAKLYLPDIFFSTESEPIMALLLFRRLVFKAEMVGGRIEDIARNTSDALSVDRRRFLWNVREGLARLSGSALEFAAYLEQCSPEEFLRCARLNRDMGDAEQLLDSLMQLLKDDDVRGNQVIEDVEKTVIVLRNLIERHVAGSDGSARQCARRELAVASVTGIEISGVRVFFDMETIEKCFLTDNAGRESLDQQSKEAQKEVLAHWSSLTRALNTIKGEAAKVKKRFGEVASEGFVVNEHMVARLQRLYGQLSTAGQFCGVLAEKCVQYVQECISSQRPVNSSLLHELSRTSAERVLKISEAMFAGALVEVIERISKDLGNVVTDMEASDCWDKVDLSAAPWVRRAQEVKNSYRVNADMEKQIESLNKEVVSLVQTAKAKDQNLQEARIKIEVLEKRIDAVRKHADTIAALETTLTKTREESRVYQEAVESLHADLKDMERENEKLLKVLKRYERQAGAGGLVSPRNVRVEQMTGTGGADAGFRGTQEDLSGHEGMQTTAYNGELYAQLASLKAALRFITAENTRLKAEKALASAASLFSLNDPLMRRAARKSIRSTVSVESLTSSFGSLDKLNILSNRKQHAQNVKQDIHELRCQASLVASSPIVVDVARRPALTDKKWSSVRNDPRIQKIEDEEKGAQLVEKSLELREHLHRVMPKKDGHGHPTQKESQGNTSHLGRVRLSTAVVAEPARRHCVVLKTRQDFEAIHAVFAI
ncbi:hypothetical protein HDU85_007432 [Gaertneriomyces sp. JEL0708]|nr:hypothetical protein HDU85_007432 [Gaertneriomyces sp. JEL0708]